ncbi:succinate dehydrogenase / fumarate reductase cytochrome b subunit [Mariniflexile fucanivorans]|uniref:Succinate dehydrogenase / fumarate reductase cytochrome b subunit n=1 Tax=Mariniflexile fucanivorans TaxID=264023 RepID=A0A4R1RSB6_9FLAO|nr:succinate dehydrogenase cytochrome b subunit [Mariniflexile fucanivorans]TCL68872.1 succinate dehydrogenase / fumarate reductase cytochrome b subunit [Mariniflexile fucanivorans]
MSGFFKSSIGRKVAMALSAFFLMFFLIIHLAVNITSLFSADVFNEMSHFMGTNPLVQFALQPVLIFGVVFHFIMGFVLELRNKKAKGVAYAKNNGAANSTWMSRNMVYSGLVILAFLVLHFIDFWFPELNYKYIAVNPEDPTRYFHELQEKFIPVWRVAAYVIAFILLGLHLAHGFASSFQSLGASTIRQKTLQTFGKAYSIIIPLGFIVIALYHHFSHH